MDAGSKGAKSVESTSMNQMKKPKGCQACGERYHPKQTCLEAWLAELKSDGNG